MMPNRGASNISQMNSSDVSWKLLVCLKKCVIFLCYSKVAPEIVGLFNDFIQATWDHICLIGACGCNGGSMMCSLPLLHDSDPTGLSDQRWRDDIHAWRQGAPRLRLWWCKQTNSIYHWAPTKKRCIIVALTSEGNSNMLCDVDLHACVHVLRWMCECELMYVGVCVCAHYSLHGPQNQK